MRITDVRVRKMTQDSKMKAIVSITIDDEFVVRIVRQQEMEDYNIYGCEIVGTASIMDYVFNDYAATLS